MISLPLVYTILALIAYTTSFWYLFIRLMSKREPNPWLFAFVTTLALLLHGTVLCNAMLTPLGINYDVFNLVSFTSWLMLLLSLIFSTFRPIVPLNLLGIPVAAIGLILGFGFSKPDQFIEQHSLGLDTPKKYILLKAYAVLLMATIHAILIWFQNRELKKKQKKRFWVNLLPPIQAMESLLFDLIITGFFYSQSLSHLAF